MDVHLINDATWDYKPSQLKNLGRSNNCYCDWFLIKNKNLIIFGEEVFLDYDDMQYTPKEKQLNW